jgi:hypothetical protein
VHLLKAQLLGFEPQLRCGRADCPAGQEMLASWAADHRAVDGRRDEVVRIAAEAGLIKSGIHRLAGIARSTLDRILGTGEGGQP